MFLKSGAIRRSLTARDVVQCEAACFGEREFKCVSYSYRRPGMSLKSGAIRRSLTARDVVQCEAACFGEREFKCFSYSYRRPGMSLKSGPIRRSLAARDVVQCEAACFGKREFKCVSYSYRYSTSRGTDNCFLSERPYRGLEMSADSGSDVYGMPQDKGCSASNRPWVESEPGFGTNMLRCFKP
ncbi:PAN/APPLE-like domain-containing protein [Operophtera brumata]|uniref:PAN/APPLE-like domain-containing protein n=1 Tax=Operophtera brumata TaxID=104452 RepID=A0A0L7L2P1_OPEBR|nr:PAN/APPLE-like domain-containing protein [Operophtera brumata]